ncbi:MAG: hypothetical protein Q8O89_05530 [Nanoarchaeota archaeon]|nr:hypothetical protein [Nanoarchaeota archaeon]
MEVYDKNLTIFANMLINSQIRFQHLKDSFYSFKDISDNWLINIRGDLRNDVIAFLQGELGDKMVLFELLDDKRAGGGWFKNSLEMITKAKCDYIFIWNEDHLNIAPQDTLNKVVEEMINNDADYLLYTYLPHWRERFNAISKSDIIQSHKYIDLANVTKKNLDLFFPTKERLCIVSAAAIFKKDFLYKVIKAERIKLPIFFTHLLYSLMTMLNRIGLVFNKKKGYDAINKLFFYKLRRFPLETPFELEISQDRKYILPMKVAVPKIELFACIDDDINYSGSQLIKRGLYPLQAISEVLQSERETSSSVFKELLEINDHYALYRLDLAKNKVYTQRYYQDEIRTQALLKESIILIKGSLVLSIGDSQKHLLPGQTVSYYPNIKYTIKANEDSVFIVISASLHNKKIKYAIN